ncbi:ATP-dependent Clp protease adaptor protein ClpS [Novosphingobium sp. Rr 2-17]|nr:ATP-dependent Clp protease adaptor protein ClpS [Novosphingobium sp. Rr 2-17]
MISAFFESDPRLRDHVPALSESAPRACVPREGVLSHIFAGPDGGPDGDGSDGGGSDGDNGDQEIGIATKTRAKPKKPSQFKVLLLNDDYTPMEFVVMVLKRFFHMDMEQATRVMLHVHQKGVGVCGIFPYEIAETKVNQVMDFARENQHPLQCTLEKA